MTARWDFLASQVAYADHLAPIWHALEPEERGRFHVWGRTKCHAVDHLGIERTAPGLPAPRGPGLVVASAGEALRRPARAVALVEHGAGQAYDVAHEAYSGGPNRDNVVLFLCPNEVVAARNRAAYPDAAVEVVGSPRLDALQLVGRRVAERQTADTGYSRVGGAGEPYSRPAEGSNPPTPSPAVVLSFHWGCGLSPEAGSALDHYRAVLPGIVRGLDVVGHGHPRYRGHFAQLWRDLRISDVQHFADVVDRAWLYVCDNSSTLYEWAALGRPVVVLNAPWYRRDLDAWPRFWRCADVGVQCDEPEDLRAAIDLALQDPPAVARRRREVVDEVFPLRDGRAAERAAHALRRIGASLR